MAAGSEVNTVWIGFMDIVPVIGTVKEAVELVLALYEGNKAVIKEKEKAVENIVQESLKKYVKKLTLPDKPAAAAAEFSGLKNVTEVRKEKIIECVMKGSKRGAKPSATEVEKRKKMVEAIKEDMIKKIRTISPNFEFNQELKEQLGRSQRGEHVFNNNILRFHSNVLTDFIEIRGISNLHGYNQQEMNTLESHTLPQNTAREIQENMVVHFADDEFYVNVNGVAYGVYCRALRDALLAVLGHINRDDVTEAERQRVNYVIDNMNNLQIYVDQLAKQKWIDNRRDSQLRQTRFENVRGEVENMYRTSRGLTWCDDIMRTVAPLFENRQ